MHVSFYISSTTVATSDLYSLTGVVVALAAQPPIQLPVVYSWIVFKNSTMISIKNCIEHVRTWTSKLRHFS